MSPKKVKHYIGIQGLWSPYSVACYGPSGLLNFQTTSTADRVLVLDSLLARVEQACDNLFDSGVLFVVPSGPGPFTGLRSVAAFVTGLLESMPEAYVISPSIFEVCAEKLPIMRDVTVCVPHHARAVFSGVCRVQQEGVALKSLHDTSLCDTPKKGVYYCNMEPLLSGKRLDVGAPELVRYGRSVQLHAFEKNVTLLYP